jgi:hypothetical protein
MESFEINVFYLEKTTRENIPVTIAIGLIFKKIFWQELDMYKIRLCETN